MKVLRLVPMIILQSVFSFSQAHALRGTYEVPTKNPDLKGSNTYEVELGNSVDFVRDGQARFVLPAELIGDAVEYKITLSTRGSLDVWTGAGIDHMTCQVVDKDYSCDVKFTPKSIVINESRIEQALRTKMPQANAQSIAKFMSVSRDFADDPIGILRYHISEASPKFLRYEVR